MSLRQAPWLLAAAALIPISASAADRPVAPAKPASAVVSATLPDAPVPALSVANAAQPVLFRPDVVASGTAFTASGTGLTAPEDAPVDPAQAAQQSTTPAQPQAATPAPAQAGTPLPAAAPAPQLSQHDQAERDVKAQEKQRVLGVLPQFNATDNPNAPPLSSGQKFDLAWHTAIDPVTFGVAAFDAGISQAENDFPGYHQGVEGYAKRFGAAYADSFDSTIIGNAMLPALLHQDPRYFRLGHGKFSHRLWYSVETTVRCKGDDGHWQFNTSNVAGNFIAGGISNIYYPASDRGFGLTISRASTVTAEGALGALFIEFWPDVRDHLHKNKDPNYKLSPMAAPGAPAPQKD